MPSRLDDHPARVGRQTPNAGRNLPAAIGVGVLLIAAIALTLWRWNWGFVFLTAAALAAGAYEVHKALLRLGMRSAIVPIVVGTIGIVVGSYYAGHDLILAGGHVLAMPSNTILLAALAATVMAALAWRMPAGPVGYVKDSAASLFIIAYVSLLGSFVTLLLAGDNGPARVLTFILAVTAADTGGYLFGSLLGRHQLSPTISPKKTYEGLAGSFLLSGVVAALAAVYLLHVPWGVGAVLAVVCTVVGTAGDLIESLVKRDAGIKDMSSFLPGHGGFMDRLDSLLVAAPAAWITLYLMVPGG